MKILKWIGIIILILILAFLGFMGYMGMLTPGDVVEKEMGPYTYVYREFTGPYNETGPVFDKVFKEIEAEGIQTTRGIGIYYDDPSTVPAEKLRSHVGVIIEPKDSERLDEIKDKYNVGKINRGKAAVFTLPIKNSLSYMIGPAIAYPTLMSYMTEKQYRMTIPLEVYDMDAEEVYYVMMIETSSP